MNTWWDGSNVSSLLRGAAVHANLPIYRTDPLQASPNLRQAMHDEANIATPIPNSSNGLPFFFSWADINTRLTDRRGPTISSSGSIDPNNPALLSANLDSELRATLPDGTLVRWWWTREPACSGPTSTVSCNYGMAHINTLGLWPTALVGGSGVRHGISAADSISENRSFRPAVWIRR